MTGKTPVKRPSYEVEDYERRRYRGLDQRLVDVRERRIVRRLLEEARKEGAGERPGFVLDAPCGYGRFSDLVQGLGFRLVSSDLSFHMVNRARVRDANHPPALGAVADLKKGLPFKSASFAVVLSMRFFHHLHESQDRANILREFARVSSRWAVLSYYELNRLHRLQRKIRRGLKGRTARIRMVKRAEFSRELEKAGFKVVRKSPLLWGVHAQKVMLLEKV